MANFSFKNSTYKFTDPIRTFKSNDPYVYFVDNIPLKQLAENTNFLKDQLQNINNLISIDRSDISELRPYVTGSDRLVRVLPGRFTARINDARQDKHQWLQRIMGQPFGDTNSYKVPSTHSGNYLDTDGNNLNTMVLAVLDKFKNGIASGANGLAERAFTYPVQDEDRKSQFNDDTEPKANGSGNFKRLPPFPLSQVIGWAHDALEDSEELKTYNFNNEVFGFAPLQRLESAFIKRWRGVARTAIVDVPSELSLSVPPFDENDFFYTDSNGNKVKITGASTRIDLVFIYTKPVDQEETTIGRFVGNLPTVINTPVLGIVKGAGVGVNYGPDDERWNQPQSVVTTNTESQILPNVGDSNSTVNGFTGLNIHGSFPSPDDLLNQAPLLANGLTETEPELVGQSVLPIAYIVTRSTDSVVESSDLIDIRPFFRTTELAYNERAGIAAAVPQLSLANPAVGKALMDKELFRAKKYVDDKVNDTKDRPAFPRPVATGLIQGGYYYGVEGVLTHYQYAEEGVSDADRATAWNNILANSSIPSDTPLALYPQWDQPTWATRSSNSDGYDSTDWGTRANDWLSPVYHAGKPNYASYSSKDQTAETDANQFIADSNTRLMSLGTGYDRNGNTFGFSFVFCHKNIRIDRSDVSWMVDYDVDVKYWNCVPLADRGSLPDGMSQAAPTGVWIDKRKGGFTIYCAWTAEDFFSKSSNNESGEYNINPRVQRDGPYFAGHVVLNDELRQARITDSAARNAGYTGESRVGICIYPTITYTVVGIPGNWKGSYNAGQNSIKLI